MSHDSLKIIEKDVIETYRIQKRLKSYDCAIKYLDFLKLKEKSSIDDLIKNLKIPRRTIMHWERKERVPWIIHVTNELKERGVFPITGSDRLARIVGYIHGDGYIFEDLGGVGFTSTEKSILNTIKNDIFHIFKIRRKLERTHKKGDIVTILGIERTARKDCFKLRYNNTGITRALYVATGVRGRKVFKSFGVPNWIVNGKKSYKREFLRGLFDSELSKFQVISFEKHENQITDPRMEMCKSEKHLQSLDKYFTQIEKFLEEFQVETYKRGPTFVRIDKSGEKIFKYAMVIRSNFKSLHNFITKIDFHSSEYKKERSKYVLGLIKEKIRNRSKIYDVLNYILDKNCFTTSDLERDLRISKSYTKVLAKLLFDNGLTSRKMEKEAGKEYIWWYEYKPIKKDIKKYLENEIMLLELVPRRRENNQRGGENENRPN